jgi:hypothetical protein
MGDVDVKLPHRLEKCVYPQGQCRCLSLRTRVKKKKPAHSLLIPGGACDAPDLLHVLQHESQAPEHEGKCIPRGTEMGVL